MKTKLLFLRPWLILSFILIIQNVSAQYTIPSKMKWWYEARFGMFIHFGTYSYLGHGEWAFATEKWTKSNYQAQVSAKFNPSSFNAGTIARLAKQAGMKYLVITAKHHEGFSMWDTKVESFKDVTNAKQYDLPDFTSFGKRDILKELKDSCDAVGVKFCLYYSILDWNHPSQTIYQQNYSTMASMSARTDYIKDMKAQLNELVEKYHPYILWFDGDWTNNTGAPSLNSWWTKNDGIALYNNLVKLDSNLIINERVFRGAGLGDFECPEQTVPNAPVGRPWETCQTMNNSWGYNMGDNNYKTSPTLIRQLVDVTSKDGNYLLNIGPKGDGTVTGESVKLLNEIGKWMEIYGESIYKTTRSPFTLTPSWGRFTKKEGKLYAHVFTWPENGKLKVPSLSNTVNKIYLMNDTTRLLNYKDSIGYYWISVPGNAPHSANSVVALDVSGVPKASDKYVKVSGIIVKGSDGMSSIANIGGTLQMQAIVSPSNATNKKVMWSVSDTSIAVINTTGLLTAKKNGTVTITAVSNDGSDILEQIQIIIGTVIQGENLLQNSNFDTQGAWMVTQCDQNGIINATFGKSGVGPQNGSGNFLELKSVGNSASQVFVYQKIVIKRGHTYRFSAAMKDASSSLKDYWIGLAYVIEKPITNQDIKEEVITSFGSWKPCTGIGFNGLLETSCAASGTYFKIPTTLTSDTIYFGINVGTWGTTSNIDLFFDNVTLNDSVQLTSASPTIKTSLFKVFPNPASNGFVNLKYDGSLFGLTSYSVINVLGCVMLSGNFINQVSLDVSNLNTGIYLIKVHNNGNSAIQKLLVARSGN